MTAFPTTDSSPASCRRPEPIDVAASRQRLDAWGQLQSIEDLICITANEVCAALLLAPIITRLRRAHPATHVETIACNAPSDQHRCEADVAVRSIACAGSALIVKKLRDDNAHVQAAAS